MTLVYLLNLLISILLDNDKDGIPDDEDLDDDNDGIYDLKEVETLSIPTVTVYLTRFDLDSDNDGCLDVTEAGFDDNDTKYTEYDTIHENITWYPTGNAPDNSNNNEHHMLLTSQGITM